MTVRELQNILNQIYDKDAEIDFSFDYIDKTTKEGVSVPLKPDFIQDDSYYKNPDKFVFIDFITPELTVNSEIEEKEIEKFWKEKTSVHFYKAPNPESGGNA